MSQKDFSDSFSKSKELCFNENEFLKDSFSIDTFLREHKNKATLEVMRDDLGTYLKSLRLSMIELINKDYEDFVNLSKDLVGLNNGILNIQVPLGQLREEVLQVKNDLEETITGLHNCLEQRRQIREKKRSLLHLTQVINSIVKLKNIVHIKSTDEKQKSLNIDLIERAAVEYNQLQFSMSKCKNELSDNQKKDAGEIGKVLTDILINIFLECLCEKQLDELSRCLRIFASLDKIHDLENLVRKEVVAPALHDLIHETALQKQPGGVKVIYEKVIDFIDKQLKELFELTTYSDKAPVVKGYHFLRNSVWPELEQRLELHMSSIFAPGNPDLFHKRFKQSMVLIEELELRCGNQTSVINLREHEQYQHFFHKWNLPVYFKIRFQEIAGQLELVLAEEDNIKIASVSNKDTNGFHLKVSSCVISSLEKCWSRDIYLPELAHMFWKLSLQILSRYAVWVNETITKLQETDLPEKKSKTEIEAIQNAVVSGEQQIQSRLDFLVCLFSDTAKIISNANSFLELSKNLIPTRRLIDEQLSTSLQDSIELIESCSPKITKSIVKVIVGESIVHLRQVSDIPRLFRRTNRESPTKSCEYVGQVLALPHKFHASHKDLVTSDVLENWLTFVFNEIATHFYACVNEVLTNAQKTEESLRKLKKIKDKSWNNSENKNSDNDKIRQQLVIDVQSFCEGVDHVSVNRAEVTMLSELVELVKSARVTTEKQ